MQHATASGPVSNTVHEIPPEVLAALALPPFVGLAEAKVRGAVCVWGGGPLTAETAVGLGEHLSPRSGSRAPVRCFPRTCRQCLANRAHQILLDHAGVCEQCVDEAAECPFGHALYRLIRQAWR